MTIIPEEIDIAGPMGEAIARGKRGEKNMSLIMGTELQALIAANASAMASNFVNIQGGDFNMGTNGIGYCERPPHKVYLSDFRMGKFPVTVGEYRELVDRLEANRFVLLGGSRGPKPKIVALGDSKDLLIRTPVQELLGGVTVRDLLAGSVQVVLNELRVVKMKVPALASKFNHPRNPLIAVNWYESVVHSLLRGALLATEAQWEYAATCRGQFRYGTASGELKKEEAHYYPHSKGSSSEVGSYPPNRFGLYDMTGNVSEWCMDWLSSYPDAGPSEDLNGVVMESHTLLDPTGSMRGGQRVVRGGSWICSDSAFLLAALRGYKAPKLWDNTIGLRLVAPLDS